MVQSTRGSARSAPRSVMASGKVDQECVMAILRTCYDACCHEREISVVDMGLIENVRVEGGRVQVDMILTTGWCPFSVRMITDMERRLRALDGVDDVEVQVVWNPVWTPERLSESAREKLTMPIPIELRRGRNAG
jgi:metal-sulfur cluster biosynthetic enzyme